jgi:hypothetical protein
VAARPHSKSTGSESECRYVTANQFRTGTKFLLNSPVLGFTEICPVSELFHAHIHMHVWINI